MDISKIEEFTTNGLVDSYDLILNKIKVFFGSKLTIAYENVKNGNYGELNARNGFHYSDVLLEDPSNKWTLNVFYNFKSTYRSGVNLTSVDYLNNAYDQISIGNTIDDNMSVVTNSSGGNLQGLRFYGLINNIFFTDVGTKGNELLITVRSGGFYSSVLISIKDYIIKVKVNNSTDNNYYRTIVSLEKEYYLLNAYNNTYNKVFYKHKDVNLEYKWRVITSTNNDTLITNQSYFANKDNKVYGIIKHQAKYLASQNVNLFPRKDGYTGGHFILEKDEDMHYGQIQAAGLIPEDEYTIGAFTYKFFPMNVHNQTSDSIYNLGIVVRVDNG